MSTPMYVLLVEGSGMKTFVAQANKQNIILNL